jgi:hypothetical protein
MNTDTASGFQSPDFKGRLFQNRDKDADHPKRPDLQGSCILAGVEYWLSGWHNVAKKTGDKYISLVFKLKEVKPSSADSEGEPPLRDVEEQEDITSELPF